MMQTLSLFLVTSFFINFILIRYRHFRLILTPRREVIHSKFKAYEVNKDGEETTVHLGLTLRLFRIIQKFYIAKTLK